MNQNARKAFDDTFSAMAMPHAERATTYFEHDGQLFRLQIDNLTKPVVIDDMGDNAWQPMLTGWPAAMTWSVHDEFQGSPIPAGGDKLSPYAKKLMQEELSGINSTLAEAAFEETSDETL